jgi:hypothetical protein
MVSDAQLPCALHPFSVQLQPGHNTPANSGGGDALPRFA